MTGHDDPPATAAEDGGDYELTLFVSGASELSARAITNATRLCDVHLHGRHRLSVLDVHDDAAGKLHRRVFALPTLVRERPLPVRRITGDLSDTDDVLLALLLPAAGSAGAARG
jgi:circadian clock protein KaiB